MTFDELLQRYSALQEKTAAVQERCASLESEKAEQQKALAAKDQEISLKDQTIALLKHELKRRLAELYGRRRERFEGHPTLPFDESALEGPIDEAPEKWESPDDESVAIPAHERRRARRLGRLPENLPREVETIELAAEDRQCHLCRGEMQLMGHESSETLDYRPATLVVKETRRVKYSCPRCHEGVMSALLPRARSIGGSRRRGCSRTWSHPNIAIICLCTGSKESWRARAWRFPNRRCAIGWPPWRRGSSRSWSAFASESWCPM